MGEWKEEKGNTVTVYDRYHFAVPVRGTVKETNNDSFKVDFFTNNPGGHNVNKLDGKWFLKGQCKVDEIHEEIPEPPSHKEIMSKKWYHDVDRKYITVLSYCEHCEIYSMSNGMGATADWFVGIQSKVVIDG